MFSVNVDPPRCDTPTNQFYARKCIEEINAEVLNEAVEGDLEEYVKSSRRLIKEINMEILDKAI